METANKTIELVSKRSLTCKQASVHWFLNLSSAGVSYLSLLNSVPRVATGHVVSDLDGPTVCVRMPGERQLDSSTRLIVLKSWYGILEQ